MAIYLADFSILGRAKSGSAVRSASYRSGERLQERGRTLGDALEAASYRSGQDLEDATGKVFSYRREDVVHSEVMLPDGAHPALADRGTLWREVERVERRGDAQLARCCTLALPRELGRDEQVELARDYAREAFVARGMVADLCIHEKAASDGGLNGHCHLMLSTRAIDPATGGFGKKCRDWNAKVMLVGWRQEWEHACNAALERAQVAERVSCERLDVQLERAIAAGDFETAAKVDRLPGVHLGPNAWEMQARGVATDIGGELAQIAEANAAVAETYAMVSELAEDVPDAIGRFLGLRQETGDALEAFAAWGDWARETLERVAEMAIDAVEHVQSVALSAWDNLVAAMSPMSDFAQAERAEADKREAALDREIDDMLAEMDLPAAAEIGQAELERDAPEGRDWLDGLLAEMDAETWQERDLELEI